MSLYAYCLCEGLSPGAAESVVGVAGARARMVECGGLWAVVSELEGVQQVAVTRENVLAHERVVRRVLAETTPLPFRFGTVVSEEHLRSYVRSGNETLRSQLERVRGCVEMSVKVIWDLEAIKDEGEGPEASASAARPRTGSGTEFLVAKRREVLGSESLERRAAELARWFEQCLGDVVSGSKVSLRPSESLVLAVAHLVGRERMKEYRDRLRRARLERGELHFLTSGPWPPYSFTSAGS